MHGLTPFLFSGGRMFDKFANDQNTTFVYSDALPPSDPDAAAETVASADLPTSSLSGATNIIVDVKQVDIIVNHKKTEYNTAAQWAGAFAEESLHAESISQGYNYSEYSFKRQRLDGFPDWKPPRYQRIQQEAADILKAVGR